MHCQLSKVLFAISIILTFVDIKNGFTVYGPPKVTLDSGFLNHRNSGADHIRHYGKYSGATGVMSKLAKRHDILLNRPSRIYETSTTRYSCSCNINHQAVDLGKEYVPRYIQTGACRMDSCNENFQCVEKTYKLKVFKQKDVKRTENPVSLGSLQNNFQDFWTIEVISIVVACECVAEFRMVYQK